MTTGKKWQQIVIIHHESLLNNTIKSIDQYCYQLRWGYEKKNIHSSVLIFLFHYLFWYKGVLHLIHFIISTNEISWCKQIMKKSFKYPILTASSYIPTHGNKKTRSLTSPSWHTYHNVSYAQELLNSLIMAPLFCAVCYCFLIINKAIVHGSIRLGGNKFNDHRRIFLRNVNQNCWLMLRSSDEVVHWLHYTFWKTQVRTNE